MSIRSILYRGFSKLANIFKQRSIAPGSMWTGEYHSWDEVKTLCTGYDSNEILQKCAASILKVKNGEAVYERDSVLFNEIQYSWGLLAGLQKAAIDNAGYLNVLDFGGSLGSTYFQNRNFLGALNKFQWNIIEQANFIDFGKEKIEDEVLKFYYTIDECIKKVSPNVMLLSNVLQYLENPYECLDKFISYKFQYIIIDRTAINTLGKDRLTMQNVPEEIYKASYPAWFLDDEKLRKCFEESYTLLANFKSSFENNVEIDENLIASWNGYIFRYNEK
jgi:putative methyltransferase (TIGR04325 family)